MATSWTALDVAKLEKAIKTGALSVSYGEGRKVTYRSLAEMLSLLAVMRGEVDQTQLGPLRKVMSTSKGLGPAPSEEFFD